MATLKLWTPERKEIIWIDFDPSAGHEMKSEHPMLVLSTKPFNQKQGMVIGLAMTSKDYNETNPFAVKLQVGDKVGYILAERIQTLDWQARRARQHEWKVCPDDVFDEACDKLNAIIQIG